MTEAMHPYLGIAVVTVAILLATVEFAIPPAWRWVKKLCRPRGR